MSTYYLSLVAFVTALACQARADEPLSAGKILVLENERTIEGEIERHGNQFRIRRNTGELWLDGGKVLQLCRDKSDAYAYLKTRANLRDADERLRLAKWCHQVGLRADALTEVREAQSLRPGHAETERLVRSLHRTEATRAIPASAGKAEESESNTITPPQLDTESISTFIARVQPTLMNACASCHASGRSGGFKLARAHSMNTSHKVTSQNLSAVLQQISGDKPATSPLLIKAVSVHGNLTLPPLKSRDVAAFRVMEEWVHRTAEAHPHLLARGHGEPRAEVQTTAIPPTGASSFAEASASAKPEEKKEAVAPAEAKDPFDPSIFNRQMHPKPTPAATTPLPSPSR